MVSKEPTPVVIYTSGWTPPVAGYLHRSEQIFALTGVLAEPGGGVAALLTRHHSPEDDSCPDHKTTRRSAAILSTHRQM
jgi:hypothetical protein